MEDVKRQSHEPRIQVRLVENESIVTVRVREIVWRESRMDEVRDGEGQSPGTTRLVLTELGWAGLKLLLPRHPLVGEGDCRGELAGQASERSISRAGALRHAIDDESDGDPAG